MGRCMGEKPRAWGVVLIIIAGVIILIIIVVGVCIVVDVS